MPFVIFNCVLHFIYVKLGGSEYNFSLTICFRHQNWKNVSLAYEKKETEATKIAFIQANNGEIIDKDLVDKDDRRLVDNLSGNQFNQW